MFDLLMKPSLIKCSNINTKAKSQLQPAHEGRLVLQMGLFLGFSLASFTASRFININNGNAIIWWHGSKTFKILIQNEKIWKTLCTTHNRQGSDSSLFSPACYFDSFPPKCCLLYCEVMFSSMWALAEKAKGPATSSAKIHRHNLIGFVSTHCCCLSTFILSLSLLLTGSAILWLCLHRSLHFWDGC